MNSVFYQYFEVYETCFIAPNAGYLASDAEPCRTRSYLLLLGAVFSKCQIK